MDRIEGPANGNPLLRPDLQHELTSEAAKTQKKHQKNSGKTSKGGFGSVLGRMFSSSESQAASTHAIDDERALQNLMDEIQQLGQRLSAFPGVDNLARYKQAIRDFLSHTTGKGYAVEEHISRRNILNQKKYSLVKVVDEKLDRLTKAMLGSQKKQLELLADIEEINGLLVDILHAS